MTKVELPPFLPSYPRLMLGIFITNIFHTIAEVTSIIFDLCRQFFADAKIFELERLLFHNLFLLFQKILGYILRTILLWKLQTNENFNKLHWIIHQTLTLMTLWIFTKNVLKKHSFLVIDATLVSDNPLLFRKNLLEKTEKN